MVYYDFNKNCGITMLIIIITLGIAGFSFADTNLVWVFVLLNGLLLISMIYCMFSVVKTYKKLRKKLK